MQSGRNRPKLRRYGGCRAAALKGPIEGGTAMSVGTESPLRSKQAKLERITVNLTPRAYRALGKAVKLTCDSKTDTVNRALQLYAYLEEITQSGGALYVRFADKDELEQLRFF